MNRLALIAALAGLIGLGGCAAGVEYGPYGGPYYSNAYPLPGYGDDYSAYGTPFGSVGVGGVWSNGGYQDWHRWRAFPRYPHWGAWRGGGFHARAGRGIWGGHGWHR